MAARKSTEELKESWREKIQASLIINRLVDHSLGKNEMSSTQINAAKIVLAKVLPDLKATEIKADVEHSGKIATLIQLVSLD